MPRAAGPPPAAHYLTGLCGGWLANVPARPVGGQRTRPQSELWTQWWRHIVQRLATIAAMLPWSCIGPQPMSACLALRIDALHGPSRQITHDASPCTQIERTRIE